MAKRKRNDAANGGPDAKSDSSTKKPRAEPAAAAPAADTVAKITTDEPPSAATPFAIQIITGSYDRILHGLIASIEPDDKVSVADTFLFNAHTTAIRCLAISEPSVPIPGQSQKVFLVSGSTDEKINVYNLSAHPPTRKGPDPLAGVTPRPVLENPKNRELGTLHHHSSTVTALSFPTRGKLLSASEDSTIAVTRTRDWALLSTIKVPLAQAKGRPSGDTASYSSLPAGANDFAVHPSLKTMISVSRGERCMRLWNLVTGKKAGVLNFGRELLADVGEGRHATGEGRKVVWGGREGGEEFAVAFDRDVAVFGVDAVARCRVMGDIKTKVHEIRYLSLDNEEDDEEKKSGLDLMAVSTEDGRILFFSTRAEDLVQPEEKEEGAAGAKGRADDERLPCAKLVASLGGRDAGVTSRIKDFTILRRTEGGKENLYVVGGSSDGKIRIWRVARDALVQAVVGGKTKKKKSEKKNEAKDAPVGELLCTYGTQNRITCLEAFVMIPRPEGVEESEDEDEGDWEDEGSDDDENDE